MMTDHRPGLTVPNRRGAQARGSCVESRGRVATATRFHASRGAADKRNCRPPVPRTTLPIYLGDIFGIAVADERSVAAEVVWTSGDNCGLRFNDPFEGALMLAEILDRAQGSRRPGLNGADQPDAPTGSAHRSANIRRSPTADDSDMAGGIEVRATLESGQRRRGILRWVQGEMASIHLLN